MFCTHCGNKIADSAKFCSFCGGEQTGIQQNQQVNAEQPVAPEQPSTQYFNQPQYQQPQYQPQYQQPAQPVQQPYTPYSGYYAPDGTPLVPAQQQYPMKWFKFLIYFTLFANALFYLADAIGSLFGVQYMILGYEPDFIYSLVDNLKMVDSVFGVIHLGFAAAYVIVRFQLAGFKRNGPKMLYILTGVETVFSILYTICTYVIFDSLPYSELTEIMASDIGSIVGTIVGAVIFLCTNITYFNKRKSLFIN